MTIAIGVFTGFIAVFAAISTDDDKRIGCHRWGPWVAVAAGSMAVAP